MVLSYIEDGKMMSKIPLYQILGAFNLNLEYFREDAIPLVENLKELAQFTMLKCVYNFFSTPILQADKTASQSGILQFFDTALKI